MDTTTVRAVVDPEVVERQLQLYDLYNGWDSDGDPDDDPDFVDEARDIMGLPPLDVPSTSRSLTPEARDAMLHGEPENPVGDMGDDADSDEDDADLTDDDAPGPDDEEDDEDLDAETLANIHALLDEEDDEAPEAMRADLALGGERLHRFWTSGKGLRKWLGHPHPWTSLYRHLRKYVGSERAKRMAAKWVHEVTGNWPGSDAHRVATGHKPRGNRIGPG